MIRFCTTGSTDTHGTLFSSYSFDLIAYRIASDDDAGESFNFSISYEMTAGEKVYLYVRGFSETATGAYSITVTTE